MATGIRVAGWPKATASLLVKPLPLSQALTASAGRKKQAARKAMQDQPAIMSLRNTVAMPVALSLLGWGLMLWAVANMASPLVGMMMPLQPSWTLGQAVAVFLMWAVMMGAMMLPSAIPSFTAHNRLRAGREPTAPVEAALFLIGYLLAWCLFSLVASALQWGLQNTGILTPMVKLNSSLVGAGILLLAGIYQLTPFKAATLTHCRNPAQALQKTWRAGRLGALHMGWAEGLCCIGCCWALMLVLFVGGVMSLTAIALLTLAVAIEKLAPKGVLLARLGGVGLIGWGLWLLVPAIGGVSGLL
jgi:predicted metal-binding membrane protein